MMAERVCQLNYADIIPKEWSANKFRQVFSFRKGLSITKENLVDDGVPVISYGQIHSKLNTGTGLNESLIRFVPETYLKTSGECLACYGDIVFADTSEDYEGVGNCALIDVKLPVFAGYHTIIARPIDQDINSKYFAYLFQTDLWRAQIRSEVMGIKVFSVTQKDLRETMIFLPPLCEQHAIADYLDRRCGQIDEIVADLQRQIECLKKYKKSLISEVVTKGLNPHAPMKDSGARCVGMIPTHWTISKIKYLIDSEHQYPIGDGDHGLIKSDDYLEEGIPYIRVLNLSWGYGLCLDNMVYISSEMNDMIKGSELKPKDLLIAKTGATIGKTAIIPSSIPVANTTSHVGKITMPNTQCAEFYYHVLNSDVVQKQIEDMSAMQSTRPELGIEGLKNLIVTVPDYNEQKQIADYLDRKCAEIDAILDDKRRQVEVMKEQRKSVIYEYVTGKKRVKEAV